MAVRARPAASLVAVWSDEEGAPHVFMGRRHPDLRFLPNCLVFPGGRVERQDSEATMRLAASCATALNTELAKPFASRFVNTALRECAEETGLHLRPGNGDLRYIARAVTPPRFPIRYDTRFFLYTLPGAEPPAPQSAGDGELLDVGWYSADDIARASVHHVTKAVLGHALDVARTQSAAPQRLLVADRTPKRWNGLSALRSAQLKAANS